MEDMAFSWFGLLVPFAVAAGIVWLLVRRRRFRALQARLALRQRVDRLAAEYTEEVQAWGGKNALLNADVVHEIIAALETEMGSPATP